MTLRTVRIALSLVALAAPAIAKEKPAPNPSLCSLTSVYIDGSNQASNALRKTAEAKTWLKVETVRSNADAILDVAHISNVPPAGDKISVKLERRDSGEFLWADDLTWNAWNPASKIWDKLSKAASCK